MVHLSDGVRGAFTKTDADGMFQVALNEPDDDRPSRLTPELVDAAAAVSPPPKAKPSGAKSAVINASPTEPDGCDSVGAVSSRESELSSGGGVVGSPPSS
jgi:hypothetical protein